jgi:hypothetical protein
MDSVQATYLVQLERLCGQIVKYSFDEGNTWKYTKLSDWYPQHFSDGSYGIVADAEVSSEGVHVMRALTDRDFAKGMVVRPTTSEEVVGKKFSYPS